MFAARGRFCLGQHREPRAAGPRLGQPRTASDSLGQPRGETRVHQGGAVRLRRGWVEWEAGTAWPPRHACVERGPTPGLCYCSGGLPRAPASSYARGGPVPRHRLPDTTRSDRRAPCGRLGRFLPPPGAGVPAQRAEGAARLWGPAAFPEQQGGQGQSSGARPRAPVHGGRGEGLRPQAPPVRGPERTREAEGGSQPTSGVSPATRNPGGGGGPSGAGPRRRGAPGPVGLRGRGLGGATVRPQLLGAGRSPATLVTMATRGRSFRVARRPGRSRAGENSGGRSRPPAHLRGVRRHANPGVRRRRLRGPAGARGRPAFRGAEGPWPRGGHRSLATRGA